MCLIIPQLNIIPDDHLPLNFAASMLVVFEYIFRQWNKRIGGTHARDVFYCNIPGMLRNGVSHSSLPEGSLTPRSDGGMNPVHHASILYAGSWSSQKTVYCKDHYQLCYKIRGRPLNSIQAIFSHRSGVRFEKVHLDTHSC